MRIFDNPNFNFIRWRWHAIALSLCSLVSFGSLVVDNSMTGATYMSDAASNIMAALLALNVLIGPGLTWWGLKPGMTVVEFWPGAGWFTDILAPYLAANNGKLIAADLEPTDPAAVEIVEAHVLRLRGQVLPAPSRRC